MADITYIRLQSEFVYLAAVLDGFSRKVVGWALERTLATRLTKTALEQAIAARQPAPGLVHHSERGVHTPQTSTCGYCKNTEFEQQLKSTTTFAGATMSCSGIGRTIDPMAPMKSINE